MPELLNDVLIGYHDHAIFLCVNGSTVPGITRLTLELANGHPPALIVALETSQVDFRAKDVAFRQEKTGND